MKSYIKWLLYFFFFLKKFEKVEKTGIISTKFSVRCTPSVMLGFRLPFKIFSTLSTTLLLAPQDFQSFLWPWVQKADSSRWWYTYCQLFRRRVVFEATRCFYFCCLSYFGFHYNFQSDLVRHTLIYANKRSFPFFSIWILMQFTLSTKNLIIILSLVKHYEFFIKTINRRVKNNKCLVHHIRILPCHKLTWVNPNYFKKQSSSSSFLLI